MEGGRSCRDSEHAVTGLRCHRVARPNVSRNLTKRFGTVRALDRLDLVAESGSVNARLGPNGAGKTILVSAVATLLRPDSGELRVAACRVRRGQSESGLSSVRGCVQQCLWYLAERLHERPEVSFKVTGRVFAIPVRLVSGFVDDLGSLVFRSPKVGVHVVDQNSH